MKVITTRVNKTIGLLRKLPGTQPRLNQAVERPYLDYGDIIYDEAYNETFHQKLELFNTMPVQPYQELLVDRQEKNFTLNQAWNPSNVDVGTGNFAYFIRFSKKINQFIYSICYHQKFEITIPEIQIKLLHFILSVTFSKLFFPSTVIKWIKLDPNFRSAASLSVFKRVC